MHCENEKDTITIKLNKHLDISSIQDLYHILKEAFELNHSVILQANEVSRIDTAGLQLLLSFYLTSQEKNITIQWQNPSPILINISNTLNIDNLLKLPLEGKTHDN